MATSDIDSYRYEQYPGYHQKNLIPSNPCILLFAQGNMLQVSLSLQLLSDLH